MELSLEGTRVMVTGAAGSIGRATLAEAIRMGAKTIIAADFDSAQLEATCNELASKHDVTVIDVLLDVSSEQSWVSCFEKIRAVAGGIDVLVNNAGTTHRKGILDTELAEWDRVVGVNQTGTFLGIKYGAQEMIRGGGGSIVNIASFTAYTGYDAAAYAASKWAVRGLTRTAANELGPKGVRVNSVSPGFLSTNLTKSAPGVVQNFRDSTPVRKAGEPEDIGSAIMYLCSPAAKYVCGHDLVVDGGFSSNWVRDLQP